MKDKLVNYIKDYPNLFVFLKSVKANVDQFGSKKKWSALLNNSCIYLELGSGKKKGSNGWTTVDMSGADITWDLRKGIPLPDNSVDKIYSSHLLEHIPAHGLIPFLQECLRVMKTNSEFLVCVPNAKLYIDSYKSKSDFFAKENCYKPALLDTGSFLDQVNYIAYMNGEHNYMFDEQNLINILYLAGFKSAFLRDFDPSFDLHERDYESIYAIAIV